jgi:hypothetical protein
MITKIKKPFIVFCILTSVSCFLFFSCGKKNNPIVKNNPQPVETGGLAVNLIWEDNTNKKFKAPEGVVTVRISVSAPNMDTITQDFDASLGSGKIIGIPPCRNMTVTANGLSVDGITLYTGETKGIEIKAGQTTTVTITLIAIIGIVWQKTYVSSGGYVFYVSSIQQTSDGGYIAAGNIGGVWFGEYSDIYIVNLDAYGNILWEKTYGGDKSDYATSIQQTTDGGYIIGGYSNSFGVGYNNFYVIKLDANGNKVWDNNYTSGNCGDEAYSIQQTNDGGYIVAGNTCRWGFGKESYFYVIKLDTSGNVVWSTIPQRGGARSIQQTTDSGYIIAGDGPDVGYYTDFYIIKLDASGSKVWEKTYGGSRDDWASSIQQTSDGGYIVAGGTWSFGAGSADFYIIKLDASGSKVWEKTYGWIDYDIAYSIQQTSDGGYIVAGSGSENIIKLDSNGNKIWGKSYDGSFSSIQQTSDGGYIVAGGNYVIKTDANGNTDPNIRPNEGDIEVHWKNKLKKR